MKHLRTIWICDLKGDLIDALEHHVGRNGVDYDLMNSVSLYHGSILDKKVDAIVSPANSFGFMDGGIDALYTKFFGPELQIELQKLINDHTWSGELLVGDAFVVPTDNPFIPFCISAPTMRIPQPITDPIGVYLATRAAIKIAEGYRFETISMPGMGTGYGNVQPMIAARAMIEGIRSVIEPVPFPKTIHEAVYRHRELKG